MFDSRRGARRVGSVLLAALAGYRNRAKDAIPLMVLPPTTHICFIRRPVQGAAASGLHAGAPVWKLVRTRPSRLVAEADRPDVRVGDGPDLRVRTHEALER